MACHDDVHSSATDSDELRLSLVEHMFKELIEGMVRGTDTQDG